MSEQAAAAVTETAPSAPAAPAGIDMEAFSSLLNLEPGKAKAESVEKLPQVAEKPTKEPEHLAAANGRKLPKEPLDPLDFDPEKLSTPDELKAVSERIIKARRQALELIRSSHNAIAHAERLKRQQTERDAKLTERETRVAAWERVVSTSVDDLESGDSERFLTAVGKLSKSGDPAGFWRNAALSLAKGEKLKPAQAAQAAADPELKARLEALENQLTAKQHAEFTAQVESIKDRNLEAAKGNDETPMVKAFAADPETADQIREELAVIMETAAGLRKSTYQHDGRPIDIGTACGRLEERLRRTFELSQRADGKANGEKGTAGSAPEAGRAPSNEHSPKPETSQATIPAALSSAPVSADRPMTEEELRKQQIRQLDAIGFF